jgi:hypothetical protein
VHPKDSKKKKDPHTTVSRSVKYMKSAKPMDNV